jgi:hypothetical protein
MGVSQPRTRNQAKLPLSLTPSKAHPQKQLILQLNLIQARTRIRQPILHRSEKPQYRKLHLRPNRAQFLTKQVTKQARISLHIRNILLHSQAWMNQLMISLIIQRQQPTLIPFPQSPQHTKQDQQTRAVPLHVEAHTK